MKKLILILGILFSFQLQAQDMPPRMEAIIKQTLASNGILTQETHQEFWLQMKKLGTDKEIQEFTNIIKNGLLFLQEYQKELWSSALQSYNNKKVIKTQRLSELEKESLIKFKASLPYTKDSKNYKIAIESYNRNMEVSNQNAKLLLEASANHTTLTSVQGQVMNINKQYIEKVLGTISSSFNRLNNLLNKDWIL